MHPANKDIVAAATDRQVPVCRFLVAYNLAFVFDSPDHKAGIPLRWACMIVLHTAQHLHVQRA